MSSLNLQNALMRPAVLQILRAAGFHNTSGAVLDVVTDLAVRYLQLLASATAHHAANNHDDLVPTVQDVRMALLEVGALRPQMSVLEERAKGTVSFGGARVPFEDTRGVEGFIKWAKGPSNREIRRIAGLSSLAGDVVEVGMLDSYEDYVTSLKNKYNKTGEDSRYQGTLLGKDLDHQAITILGGPMGSIQDWNHQSRLRVVPPQLSSPESSAFSSVPLTPTDNVFGDD